MSSSWKLSYDVLLFFWADRRYTEVDACKTALTRRCQESKMPITRR